MTASLLGKENVLLQGIERAIQDEHDEQLRILNESNISDQALR